MHQNSDLQDDDGHQNQSETVPLFWVSFVSAIAWIRLPDPARVRLDKQLDPNGRSLPSLSSFLALWGQAHPTALGQNQGPAHHSYQLAGPGNVDPGGVGKPTTYKAKGNTKSLTKSPSQQISM